MFIEKPPEFPLQSPNLANRAVFKIFFTKSVLKDREGYSKAGSCPTHICNAKMKLLLKFFNLKSEVLKENTQY